MAYTEEEKKLMDEGALACTNAIQAMKNKGATTELCLNVLAKSCGDILTEAYGANTEQVMRELPHFVNVMMRYRDCNLELLNTKMS